MGLLFTLELRKTLVSPAIAAFIALSLATNAILAIADTAEFERETDDPPANVFEGFSTGDLADYYIKRYGVSERHAGKVRAKYARLQPVVDEKAARGDALSPYLGHSTYHQHSLLFGTLFSAVTAEACMLSMLLALASVTFENTRNTEQLVYSSKTGRSLVKVKLIASLAASLSATATILGISLAVFLSKFDWHGVWGDNVSSGFNFDHWLYGVPFMTWRSLSAGAYLSAAIAVVFLLSVCFCLIGYAVGVRVRSDRASVLLALALVATMLFSQAVFPAGSPVRSALNMTPAGLWTNCGAWFTDGGVNVLWANYETIGLAGSLLALSCLAFLAAMHFKSRELA